MAQAQGQAKGFFAGLFDFGFTTFITLKFLKVIYAVMVALILLFGAGSFIIMLVSGGLRVLVAIVVVPVLTLVYLVIARVSLEAVALFFRIGENTSVLAGRGPLAGSSPAAVAASGAVDPGPGPVAPGYSPGV